MLIQENLHLSRSDPDGEGGQQFLYKVNQYGISLSLVKYLFDDFYISFDHDQKIKSISGGDEFNNSYSFLRLGY